MRYMRQILSHLQTYAQQVLNKQGWKYHSRYLQLQKQGRNVKFEKSMYVHSHPPPSSSSAEMNK